MGKSILILLLFLVAGCSTDDSLKTVNLPEVTPAPGIANVKAEIVNISQGESFDSIEIKVSDFSKGGNTSPLVKGENIVFSVPSGEQIRSRFLDYHTKKESILIKIKSVEQLGTQEKAWQFLGFLN